MNLEAVLARYGARIRELQAAINDGGGINSLGLGILAVGMFLVLGLSAIRGEMPRWVPAMMTSGLLGW